MRVCRNSVTAVSGPRAAEAPAPEGLADPESVELLLRLPSRHDLLRRGCVLGENDLRHAVLPLANQELALGPALLVPAERTEDGVHLVLAQPVGQLELVLAGDAA